MRNKPEGMLFSDGISAREKRGEASLAFRIMHIWNVNMRDM